jgi:sec-independent protein translocase protein TatB
MLDVGFSEILLTSAIALIVLGPERLPKVARQVGNWMGRARAMARQLSEQLEREVSAEELLKTQSKPGPGANATGGPHSPSNGAAFDPSYSPSIAPPTMVAAPPTVAPPPEAAPPSPSPPEPTYGETPPPSPSPPEPTYGRPAAATTPAAMHAADPPVADPHAAATDTQSPHG